MAKITFLGAGSTIFAKNILGDSMLSEPLADAHIALYDIDPVRLEDSRVMIECLNANINEGRDTITAHLGTENRREALRGADYIVNAIQVGGYDPCTITDFEIPRKYGLRQTIADTLGIGGIFRALRTIPVMLDIAADIRAVCPEAWMLNYTNPMAMITSGVIRGGGVKCVGLCHSVQGCAETVLRDVRIWDDVSSHKNLRWKIAGINHQAWLLELFDGETDLYPRVKALAAEMVAEAQAIGAAEIVRLAKEAEGDAWWGERHRLGRVAHDMVRLEVMRNFGHYITESSEHFSEYCPWFIRKTHPELIERFNIPLDEYPRRCVNQIEGWKKQREKLIADPQLDHKRTHEYGSFIMEAMETDVPFRIHGNVMNANLITNLPQKACVEVPCLVDRNGVQPCVVGDLPEQLAAINRTNVNVQILAVEAVLTGRRDTIYQAAMLDPITSANLSIDEIRAMCDEMIEAHGDWMPKFN